MALKIAAVIIKNTYIGFPRASGSEPEEPTLFCSKKPKENTKNALKKARKMALKSVAVLLKIFHLYPKTYYFFPKIRHDFQN